MLLQIEARPSNHEHHLLMFVSAELWGTISVLGSYRIVCVSGVELRWVLGVCGEHGDAMFVVSFTYRSSLWERRKGGNA